MISFDDTNLQLIFHMAILFFVYFFRNIKKIGFKTDKSLILLGLLTILCDSNYLLKYPIVNK